MLQAFTRTSTTHVPSKGSALALVALLGGQIDFLFTAILTAMPLVEQNRVRAIAVTTSKRNATMANLPPVSESPGLEDFEVYLWYGLLSPAKTDQAIIDRLYDGE